MKDFLKMLKMMEEFQEQEVLKYSKNDKSKNKCGFTKGITRLKDGIHEEKRKHLQTIKLVIANLERIKNEG